MSSYANLIVSVSLICRLEFSWASVELTKTEYRVCEGKGPLSLTVQRKGNMQDSSYVTLKVNVKPSILG